MILFTSSDTGREENRRGPGVPPKNWQLSDLQDHNTNEVASTKETTFDDTTLKNDAMWFTHEVRDNSEKLVKRSEG